MFTLKRTLQAVIFDLDGVIVDTFELYYQANKMVADKLGVPFTIEDNEQFRGIGRNEIIDALANKSNKTVSLREKAMLAHEKNRYYQQLIENMDEQSVLPGMKELIIELSRNKIKIGIASSSTNGEVVLHKVGLFSYMDYIVDPKTLLKGKPDPEIFLLAAEALRVSEENCAAIEDGMAGMKAIHSTKMFSIGIGKDPIMETADWHVVTTAEITFPELVNRMEADH